MTATVYEKLREQLDQYSTGFPETASGVEFKILQKLFTETEAALYLDLSLLLETPESVSQRTGREMTAVVGSLKTMAEKGLIFRLRKGDDVKYAASPFVIGSYEFQLNHMDRELAELVETYFEEVFFTTMVDNIVPLRTIPVNKSMEISNKVAPYGDAKEIIKTKEKIAVAECICRKQQGLVGKGCDKPMEVCMMFGSHADYYVENKMARYINQDEAISILDRCEEAGLVNQPANSINPGGMCNCCGDCCGVLRALNRLPNPAEHVFNNYFAKVDEDQCNGCETCFERCQMEAINLNEDQIAIINEDRCIGCGLCVTACPESSITLILKPEDQRRTLPSDGKELMARTAEIRGTSLKPLYMRMEK